MYGFALFIYDVDVNVPVGNHSSVKFSSYLAIDNHALAILPG